ncbi:major facilitator superfamily transporter [Ceratobasidium sp. AG-Ba]|nr:major facilitator superfamily transporter [Ceratobasidium sp. AG-Ba]
MAGSTATSSASPAPAMIHPAGDVEKDVAPSTSHVGSITPLAGSSKEAQAVARPPTSRAETSSKLGAAPQPRAPALVHRPVDRFTLLANLQNPKSYSKSHKILITFVVGIASFAGPFASNSLQPAFPELQQSWNIPDAVVALTTTLFLCATGIAPLWHAYLSERYGRRPVYIVGFLIFTVASVVCAVSTNVAFLLSFRFIQAAGASCAQSVGLGIIADIYVPEERGRATGWPAVLATRLGCVDHLDFHLALNDVVQCDIRRGDRGIDRPFSTRNFQCTQGTASRGAREPRPPAVKSKESFLHAFKSLFQLFIVRPFRTMPPIMQFNSLEIALAYIPPAIGYLIGSVSGGYLSDYAYRRAKARDGDRFVPESRLVTAWCGVPFMPIGLLIFGWTLRTGQKWPVPLTGSFIFGLGFMLGTGTIMAYFADVIPGQSASVVACFNLLRNVAAALSAALAAPALNNIGQGWYFTIMSILIGLMSLNLLAVRRWGDHWRQQREEDIAASR